MTTSPALPRHLRPRREKVFGPAQGIPLDGNAKTRIMVYARAWSAKHKRPGQHRGPLTRAFMEVLEALLWGFHNSKSGRCFPSYESIAAKADCNRDTVYEAIKALEFANVLTWVNRLARIREPDTDLFGHRVSRWRTILTSNAYIFRDPLPCAENRRDDRRSSKSENPTGTLIQEIHSLKQEPRIIVLEQGKPLDDALIRLGKAVGRFGDEATAS